MRIQSSNYGLDSGAEVVGHGDGSRFTARSVPLMSTVDRFSAAFAGRPRPVITTVEFKALLAALGDDVAELDLKEIAMIVFCTGILPEDLANIRWDDIDLEHREIWICGSRDRGSLRVPFGDQISNILQARRARERFAAVGSYVFSESVLLDVSERLKSLSMQVLMRPVTLGTLRLAFLMRWREVGENLAALALITGFAPLRLKSRGQSMEPLFRTAAKIQNWLESLV